MLSGALSAVYRTFGIKRSPRNPNICTRCSTHVEEGKMVEITVLFADLSSFTELTQDLGAERTHEVVDAYLRMATEILVKHGAFIDKYVGDAVMALFNVPIRHDDHPLRAVSAATELSAALKTLGADYKLDLTASIGIATGFARVGRLGLTWRRACKEKPAPAKFSSAKKVLRNTQRSLAKRNRSKSRLKVSGSRLPRIVCSAIKLRA